MVLCTNQGQSLLIGWDPILAVSGVLIFVASFSIGMGAIPWVIMSEIYNSFHRLWQLISVVGLFSSSGTFFVYARLAHKLTFRGENGTRNQGENTGGNSGVHQHTGKNKVMSRVYWKLIQESRIGNEA
ncbi:hypothetical protein C3L33_14895, partial [Rhododendron williamsianum]